MNIFLIFDLHFKVLTIFRVGRYLSWMIIQNQFSLQQTKTTMSSFRQTNLWFFFFFLFLQQFSKRRHKRQIPLVTGSDFDASWRKRIVDYHNILRRRETNAADMLIMVSKLNYSIAVFHCIVDSSMIAFKFKENIVNLFESITGLSRIEFCFVVITYKMS